MIWRLVMIFACCYPAIWRHLGEEVDLTFAVWVLNVSVLLALTEIIEKREK